MNASALKIIKEVSNREKAESYRSIALLSKVRRFVEKEIDMAKRGIVSFFALQCGFRKEVGVQHSILRIRDALRNGFRFIGILDLKDAYPSVPRAQLISVISKRLPANVVNMVSILLHADIISLIGDETKAKRELSRGVPEGSPVSPTFFNLYIDTLGRRLMKLP